MKEKFLFLLVATTPFVCEGITPADKALQNKANQSKVVSTYVSQVLSGGRVVVMQDGTRWAIDPKDVDKTGGWLGPAEVKISPNPNGKVYKYHIRNVWTNSTVNANPIIEPSE